MKRFFLFLILIFTLSLNLFAQTDIGSLQKCKDYLNHKLTFFAIKERSVKDPLLTPAFDSVKSGLQNVTIESVQGYDQLKILLLSKFNRALIKISEPLNDLELNQYEKLNHKDASTALVEKSFEILKKGYPDEYNSISPHKDELINDVLNYLTASSKNISQETPQDGASEDSIITIAQLDTPKNSVDESNSSSGKKFSFWTLVPILISLLLFFVLIKKMIRLDDRIDKRKTEFNLFKDAYEEQKARGGSGTGLTNSDIDKKIRDNDKIWELTQAISKLQLQLAKFEANTYGTGIKQEQVNTQSKQADIEVNSFYMSSPSNNYFPNTAKSVTKENTVYKFIVNNNKTEASFEIHTMGAPVSEIAKRRESYIKPACDEENLPSPTVKNILTKKVGLARLEGDKWIIITKALIKYE